MSVEAGHEIEVKLGIGSVDVLLRAGIALEVESERHFEENLLFDTPDRKLQSRLATLRVRSARGRGTLTYKEPPAAGASASRFKKRVEIETGLSDPAQMVALLERLGYHKWFRYEKYRTVYRASLPSGASLHVMFDETPLGSFAELEGTEEAITEAVHLLGATPADYILDSYLLLQMKHCAARGVPLEDMVFPGSAV